MQWRGHWKILLRKLNPPKKITNIIGIKAGDDGKNAWWELCGPILYLFLVNRPCTVAHASWQQAGRITNLYAYSKDSNPSKCWLHARCCQCHIDCTCVPLHKNQIIITNDYKRYHVQSSYHLHLCRAFVTGVEGNRMQLSNANILSKKSNRKPCCSLTDMQLQAAAVEFFFS